VTDIPATIHTVLLLQLPSKTKAYTLWTKHPTCLLECHPIQIGGTDELPKHTMVLQLLPITLFLNI
jgi:hypothetical protein